MEEVIFMTIDKIDSLAMMLKTDRSKVDVFVISNEHSNIYTFINKVFHITFAFYRNSFCYATKYNGGFVETYTTINYISMLVSEILEW